MLGRREGGFVSGAWTSNLSLALMLGEDFRCKLSFRAVFAPSRQSHPLRDSPRYSPHGRFMLYCYELCGLERRGHSRHFHEETPFTFAGLACFIPLDNRADVATSAASACAADVATTINTATGSGLAVSVGER